VVSCEAFFRAFRDQGVEFFTGVPDSLLKDFCAYVTDHAEPEAHIIAANEGSSVALAMGHFLATGRPALVYMQNSGFGNTLNPLLSLADPDVYGVPMVLLVGWRGEPGTKDEPQHVKQGRIMEPLLDALEIPYLILERDSPDPEGLVAQSCRSAVDREGPVVILVRKDTFAGYELHTANESSFPMNREGALKLVMDHLEDPHVIVSTTGKTSRELFEYRAARAAGHGRDFLTVGGMGHASQIALGIALERPEVQVYCIDGDGAVLMHMGALAVNATQAPANYTHIVLNNGAHDSVGGQPTVGFEVDLPSIALACGYRGAMRARDPDQIRTALRQLRELPGPLLLEIQVNKGARSDLGRPTTGPKENRDALMRYLDLGVEG
jgi:phosphonopyruvate decarboxylase